MSFPPGTIQGTTPTPSRKTTEHSAATSHSSLVKTLFYKSITEINELLSFSSNIRENSPQATSCFYPTFFAIYHSPLFL